MTNNLRRKTPKTGETVLRPVHPNVGIEIQYRRELTKLIEAMAKSVDYWLKATYRQNENRIVAEDESPADALRRSMKELSKRWLDKFDDMSIKMAEYFTQSVEKRSSAAMKKILADGGWSVRFQITPGMKDIMDATVHANVSLIKSIPEKFLADVEGSVMRSVQSGRDLGQLSKDLQTHFGVTKRRAAFIARSQNNLATAAFTRARQQELGITEAVWQHSSGGREPRKSHVTNSGKKYSVDTGWYDPDAKQWVFPGTLPNCRCISKPVVKGFS
ncbi:MAG: phage head morphogenesis protein [Rhizomicrobium sp.]